MSAHDQASQNPDTDKIKSRHRPYPLNEELLAARFLGERESFFFEELSFTPVDGHISVDVWSVLLELSGL